MASIRRKAKQPKPKRKVAQQVVRVPVHKPVVHKPAQKAPVRRVRGVAVVKVVRVTLSKLGHYVTHYAVHMLDTDDSRKFVAINVFRFGLAAGLLYVASHDHWDHVHNFLLGYHVRLIHSHLLGDEV